MIIKVTEKHIQDGRKGSCYQCPVALAVTEQCSSRPDYHFTLVTWWMIAINLDKITPPPEVTSFILDFDRGRPVQPFEFDLNLENIV